MLAPKTVVQPLMSGRCLPPNLVDDAEDVDNAEPSSSTVVAAVCPLSPMTVAPPPPGPPMTHVGARLEARLEEWLRRLESKLDAISEAWQSASGGPPAMHFVSHRSGGVVHSATLRRSSMDKHAWRVALAERGRGNPKTPSPGSLRGKRRSAPDMLEERCAGFAVAGGEPRDGLPERASSKVSSPNSRRRRHNVPGMLEERRENFGAAAESSDASACRTVALRNSARGSSDSIESSLQPASPCPDRQGSLHSQSSLCTAPASPSRPGSVGSAGSLDSKQGASQLNGSGSEREKEASKRLRRSASNTSRSKIKHTILTQLSTVSSEGHFADRDSGRRQTTRRNMESKLARKFSTMKLEAHENNSIISRIVTYSIFDFAITVVICLNALLIGASVQTDFFDVAEYLCTAIFLSELGARIYVHRRRFFMDLRERWWNYFDFFLVSISLVDAMLFMSVGGEKGLPSSAGFLGNLLRVFRMARIMRIVRTVRFLSQLRIMTHMIVSSMMSLFWIFVILAALIYVFAIILTQGATDYLKQEDIPVDHSKVSQHFGSLFQTMYTLFQAMSGGVNWGEVSVTMRGPSWVYEFVVVGYIFFTLFAVVNIVTGVFVDGAIELAKRDRTVLMQKQIKDNEAKEALLLGLLQALDQDGDEHITVEEFKDGLQKEEVKNFISAMQVEINDAEAFFSMLDEDGSGEVDLVEFVTGMQRLRGEAKSVDIHMMLHENRKMLRMVSGLVDLVGDVLSAEDAIDITETASQPGSPSVACRQPACVQLELPESLA